MRTVLSVLLVTALGIAVAAPGTATAGASPDPVPPAPALKCTPPIKCCRICDKGKACGNTCIAADKQCHKGRGCACDVDEVCAEDP